MCENKFINIMEFFESSIKTIHAGEIIYPFGNGILDPRCHFL